MSDNRPIVYKENDRWIFRASSVGRPLRCLMLAMHEYQELPAPDYLMKAAEAGNAAEVTVKKQLRAEGYVITGEQHVIEIEVTPTIIIRGHADSWHIHGNELADSHLLEVKSMSSRVWDDWTRHRFDTFAEYAAQITTYMHAAGRPAFYARYNRDTEELETEIIIIPPLDFQKDVASKALIAVKLFESGTLPHCSGAKYQCSYSYFCDHRDYLFEEVESGTDTVLLHLAQEYREVLDLEKEMKSRKAAVGRELKEAMGQKKKVQVDDWKITMVTSTSPRRLDERALRARMGDSLNKYYTDGKEYVYPKVTAPKGER